MSDAIMDALTTALDAEAAEAPAEAEGEAEPVETEAEPPSEAEPEPEPEAPKPPDPRDPKGKAALDPALYTDEALSTKQGIIAAREAIKQREQYTNKTYLRTQERNQASRETEAQAQRKHQTADTYLNGVLSDIHAIRTAGNPNLTLQAMARLFQRDGLQVYEELTDYLLGQRKNAKADPTAEVKSELQQIKDHLRQRDEQAAAATLNHARIVAESNIAAMAQDPGRFPACAHYAAKGREFVEEMVKQALGECKAHYEATRQPLDWQTALGKIESAMLPHAQAEGMQTGNQPDVGRAPNGNPKPGTQARLPGRSVSPARAAATGRVKSTDEMTEDERMDALSRDPDILSMLGMSL